MTILEFLLQLVVNSTAIGNCQKITFNDVLIQLIVLE